MALRFKLLCGDVCGFPAVFAARVDETTFAVYSQDEWANMDSSAIERYGRYNVQSGYVDIASEHVDSALSFSGMALNEKGDVWCHHSGDVVAASGSKNHPLVIVECLWAYGAADVACDVSGNNIRKLVREAKEAL